MIIHICFYIAMNSCFLNKYTLAATLDAIIKDCLNLTSDLCGVCGRTSLEDPEKCTYPFSYRFEVEDKSNGKCKASSTDGSCKEISSHCKSLSCLNGGTCKEGFGTFRCLCTNTHYGMRCEHERKDNKKKYAAGIQVFLSQQVRFNTNATLIISTDVGGSDLLIKMESDFFHLNYVDTPNHNLKHHSPEMRQKYCKDQTGLSDAQCRFIRDASNDIYSMMYNFPVINSTTGPFLFKGDHFPYDSTEDRIGYVSSLTITAYQTKRPTVEKLTYLERDNLPVFSKSYEILVYYNNQTYCIAVISQKDDTICSISPRKRPVYPPHQRLKVPFRYDTFEYNCAQKSGERQITDEFIARTVYPHYFEKDSTVLQYDWVPWGTDYYSQGYEFGSGIISYEYYGYINNSRFDLSIIESLKFHSGLTPGSFSRCFFEIQRERLVPKINYGINQTFYINTEDGLIIDATRSTNFNRRDRLRLFKWSCKFGDTNTPCFTQYVYNDTSDYFVFRKNLLEIDKVYNFSLKLHEPTYELTTAYAYLVVQVGTNRMILRLSCPECWSGILAKPNDYNILVLKHIGKRFKQEGEFKYLWKYREIGEQTYKSADNIRVNETEETVFKIEKQVLQYSKSYEFYVSIAEHPDVYTTLIIQIPNRHVQSCDVNPKEGIKGVTLFNIKCLVLPDYGVTYSYEFFDKSETDENMFSGRMLGTSVTGDLYKFRLTRGVIAVVSFDSHKVTEEIHETVTLHPFDRDEAYIDGLTDILKIDATHETTGILHLKNSQRDLALTSVIAEILTPDMNRNYVFRDLIYRIFESEMFYISEVKLCLSSIRNILEAMFQTLHELTLDADVAKHCADVILRITTNLVYRVDHIDIEKTITELVCDQLAEYVLDSVSIVASYKNKEVLNNIEEFVNPVILDLVQQTSNELVKSLDQISHMLLRLRTPGDSPLELTSLRRKITSWVKVGHPKDVHHITVSKELFPLSISKDLAATMRDDSYTGVQFILMNVNPFWWAGGNIVTQVLFVILCDKNPNTMNYKKFHTLPNPIKLYFNITKSVQSIKPIIGETKQLSNSMTDVEKDLSLAVYRFDPPVRAKLFTKFLFEGSEEYMVLFKKNLRPDYDEMAVEATLINVDNPIYNIPYEAIDSDNIYYMGIMPVVSSKDHNKKLLFKLNIYYTKCNIWLKWQWSDRGCWVGEDTNDTALECDCSHLSLFAGTVLTPPNDKFDFWDSELILTSKVNYLPFITLLLVIVIYVVLFMCSVLLDRKDKYRCNIILLKDNYPGDKYGYLIAVYTGSKIKSGTDANVGIKLLGSKADSRSHILKSSTRKTLRTGSDDWFLIFCPNHLGHLTCLHLWHDNSMNNPDWFLEKIKVFDLKEELEYMFFIYAWIAFNLEMFPEALVAPIGLKDSLEMNSSFTNNLTVGFRDSHYWTSVLWRHPRDPLTRVYRLQVVFCFVMTAMAVSLLLYLARYTFTSDEDEPSYKLTGFDYWVLFVSFLSALFISCFTMAILKNSFSQKYKRNRSSLVIKEEFSKTFQENLLKNKNKSSSSHSLDLVISNSIHDGLFIDVKDEKEEKKAGAFHRLRLGIYKILCRSPLAPVQLEHARSETLVHKHCLICVWLMCITITLICCSIVLIFGWAIEPVHGYQWLTIFILTLIIDIFVFSTLKLIISSVLLSLFCKRIISMDVFRLDSKEGIKKDLVGDPDHLCTILELRSQDMYIPLMHQMKDIYLNKFHRRLRWEIIFDFIVIVLFLTVMAMVTTIFTTVVYPSNRHAKLMMSHGHFTSSHPNFQEIFNRTDVEEFLHYNFITQLYRFLWYNLVTLVDIGSQPHPRLDWTDDCVTRLVGNAYLRQLRVVSGVCQKVRHMENVSSSCSPAWSSGQEDRGTYYIGWTSDDSEDSLMSTTAWMYLPPDGFSSSQYYGASGTLYPAGGYFGHLGYKKRETQYFVSKLIKDSWLDHSTRALFAELTLYNVNTNLFSHVSLIAEQLPTGEFLPRVEVESIAIDLSFNLWNISFIVFLVCFTVRTFFLINKFGFSKILSNNIHRLEVFLVCLGFLSIFMYFYHLSTSSEYVESYQRRGINEFFSFIKISKYSFIFQTMMCLLFVFLVLLMMCSFRYGKIFLRFFYTLYLSRHCLILLTLCLITSLVVLWRSISYLIKVVLFNNYPSIILRPKDLNIYYKNLETPLSSKIFFVILFILSGIAMMMIITSFVHFYRIAQGYKILEVDYFNFVEFFSDEIKQRKNPLKKYSELEKHSR